MAGMKSEKATNVFLHNFSLGKGSKEKKKKKLIKISFRYVRVAETFEILVFFPFFFPTYFE